MKVVGGFGSVRLDLSVCVCVFLLPPQSLLLSLWLHREKDVLKKPKEAVRNLHALLAALSSMKGACSHRHAFQKRVRLACSHPWAVEERPTIQKGR